LAGRRAGGRAILTEKTFVKIEQLPPVAVFLERYKRLATSALENVNNFLNKE
jgi:hypothetical protein